jgi:DNA-binding transcriptional LysR family regulator
LAGEVDFAICGLVQQHADIASISVVRDRFGVLGTRSNLASSAAALQWSDLDPTRYVALASSYGIRQLIDRHRVGTDTLRHPRYEVSSTASLGLLLSEGIGYGIVPAMTAQPMLEQGMIFRPLDGPVLHRKLHIIKRKNRSLSPAASALVEQFAPIIASLKMIDGIEVLLDGKATTQFIES